MIGLDSNVLLRWLVDAAIWPNDTPEQAAAVERLFGSAGESFFVNHVVIAEIVWVLAQGMKQPRATVAEAIGRMLHSDIIVDQRAVVEDALTAFRDEPGDFPDHLIAAINAAAKCATTVTFDKKASRAGRFTRLILER